MTTYEAIEAAASCKGQFPRMTEEQVFGLKEQLAKFSRGAAERAIIDMAREVEEWNTARFITIVKRHQVEINEERQSEAKAVRWQGSHALKSDYELAERAAAAETDEELRRMRDELFVHRPDLRDIYGPNVDPRKRRSLLVVMFAPASQAATAPVDLRVAS